MSTETLIAFWVLGTGKVRWTRHVRRAGDAAALCGFVPETTTLTASQCGDGRWLDGGSKTKCRECEALLESK
ncbi:MAG: hypothetical protein ACRDHF_14205 [Tepidiformaceae bacterium]